jgi:hypothetical protein
VGKPFFTPRVAEVVLKGYLGRNAEEETDRRWSRMSIAQLQEVRRPKRG